MSDIDFSPIAIRTNEEGLVILPKDYLKVRHPVDIVEKAIRKKIEPKFKDYLIKDIWNYL